jgi:hypothetical protein
MQPFTFAYPTSGNRPCLLSSIKGFADHAARYGHHPSILVSVDAPLTGTMARQLPELLAHIEQHYGFSTRLFDLENREEIYRKLEPVASRDLLEYALLRPTDGPGWGCNVNVSMLLSAGGFLLSTDDDILCRPAIPVGTTYTDRVVPHDSSTPSLMRYYRNREELLRSVTPMEIDLVAAYLALLGKKAGELLAEIPDEMTPEDKVYLVSPGTYGDTAMGNSVNTVILEGASRQRLHEEGYEQLRLSRNLVRIATAPTLTKGLTFMATQFAADNRTPLPPFMTYGRNIDGAAATALRILYPKSLNGHLGAGLYHNPPVERIAVEADLSTPKRALSELMMALMMGSIPPAEMSNTSERFAHMGQCLQEVASLATGKFVEITHEMVSRLQYPKYLNLLEMKEQHAGESPRWDRDMEQLLLNMEETFREPMSLFDTQGCGLPPAKAQWHLAMYGQLLEAWPKMHRAMSVSSTKKCK